MRGSGSEQGRRSGRRSRRSRQSFLRGPDIGRNIAIAMGIALFVYLLISAIEIRRAWREYGNVALGLTQAEVRYGNNIPHQVRGGPGASWVSVPDPGRIDSYPNWAYDLPSGGRYEIAFDPQYRTVASITCIQPAAQTYACPSTMGIMLGDLEDEIAWRIGDPTQQEIVGTTKIMKYSDLGLDLALSQFRLYCITLRQDQNGLWEKAMRYIRTLIP